MSDSMGSFDSLANTATPGDDPLPPDLVPVHDHVLRDSALWRASLPDTDALARQVISLSQRKPESRQVSYRVREELQMQDPTHTHIETPIETPPSRPVDISHSAHSRTRGFVAGGTALVLVALFVTFFAVLPHGGQTGKNGGIGTTQATATATAMVHGHTCSYRHDICGFFREVAARRRPNTYGQCASHKPPLPPRRL